MLSLQARLIPLFPRLRRQLPGSPGLAFPREHTAPGIRSHSRSDLPNPCPYPTFGLASPMALQTSVPPERVGPLGSNPLGPQDPESSWCWVPCLVTRLVALPGEPHPQETSLWVPSRCCVPPTLLELTWMELRWAGGPWGEPSSGPAGSYMDSPSCHCLRAPLWAEQLVK